MPLERAFRAGIACHRNVAPARSSTTLAPSWLRWTRVGRPSIVLIRVALLTFRRLYRLSMAPKKRSPAQMAGIDGARKKAKETAANRRAAAASADSAESNEDGQRMDRTVGTAGGSAEVAVEATHRREVAVDAQERPDAPAAADRGPDLEDPQEPNVLPPADSDVLELTLDIVLEALEAAWADGNRCTMPDVQAQLAADDVDIPIEELAKLLAELEHSRELCICSESILWRCIA